MQAKHNLTATSGDWASNPSPFQACPEPAERGEDEGGGMTP